MVLKEANVIVILEFVFVSDRMVSGLVLRYIITHWRDSAGQAKYCNSSIFSRFLWLSIVSGSSEDCCFSLPIHATLSHDI